MDGFSNFSGNLFAVMVYGTLVCKKILLNSSLRPVMWGIEMKTFFMTSRLVSLFMMGVCGILSGSLLIQSR